jgi:hypothetical protein
VEDGDVKDEAAAIKEAEAVGERKDNTEVFRLVYKGQGVLY